MDGQPPSHRVVLIDAVLDATVLDELDGWRLIGGSDTVALVGPDGHVRASHFVTDGAVGFRGAFLSAGEVVLASAAQDGFRGPFAGGIHRWNLDTDSSRLLRAVYGNLPLLARLEGVVAVVTPTQPALFGVTATGMDSYRHDAIELACSAGAGRECFVLLASEGDHAWRLRAEDTHLALARTEPPLPLPPAQRPRAASGLPVSRSLGARTFSAELASTTRALVIGSNRRIQLDGAGISVGPRRRSQIGPSAPRLHCADDDVVDPDDDVVVAGGCPIQDLDYDDGYAISVSRDGAFWLDQRLHAEAIVHRAADGATLRAQVTADGVLVSTPSGVFEGLGAVLEHVVVREPGSVRDATITTGPEARARFERPGLTAAFFRGEPLPTAP